MLAPFMCDHRNGVDAKAQRGKTEQPQNGVRLSVAETMLRSPQCSDIAVETATAAAVSKKCWCECGRRSRRAPITRHFCGCSVVHLCAFASKPLQLPFQHLNKNENRRSATIAAPAVSLHRHNDVTARQASEPSAPAPSSCCWRARNQESVRPDRSRVSPVPCPRSCSGARSAPCSCSTLRPDS